MGKYKQQTNCALFTSEEHYRNLIENAMVGVFTSPLDGQFTFVNKALARMFDFDNPEQMLADGTQSFQKNDLSTSKI